MRQPKPYEVRRLFRLYLANLLSYNNREISGFNKCGMGSATYLQRVIENRREYLRQWGHLLTKYEVLEEQ